MMLSSALFKEYAELKAKHQKEVEELQSRCTHEYYFLCGNPHGGKVTRRCRDCGNIAIEDRATRKWIHLVFGKFVEYTRYDEV